MAVEVDCFKRETVQGTIDCFKSSHPTIMVEEGEWDLVQKYLEGRNKIKGSGGGSREVSEFNKDWQNTAAGYLAMGKKLTDEEKELLVDQFLGRVGIFVQLITHHFSSN